MPQRPGIVHRARYEVTVVCMKPPGKSFTYVTADTVSEPGAVVVVAGSSGKAEAFAHLG